MYRSVKDGVLRLSDNQFIKDDPLDGDGWFEYQVWLSEGNTPEPDPSFYDPIEDERAVRIKEINDWADAQLASITGRYPEHEVVTWDKQEAEARAFLVDETAFTPLLDQISLFRDIDKRLLCHKVVEKAEAFAVFTGDVIGRRQALEDRVEAAATSGDLQKILEDL